MNRVAAYKADVQGSAKNTSNKAREHFFFLKI